MDADDVAMPDRLQQQVAFLSEHPEVVCVGSRVLLTDPDRPSAGPRPSGNRTRRTGRGGPDGDLPAEPPERLDACRGGPGRRRLPVESVPGRGPRPVPPAGRGRPPGQPPRAFDHYRLHRTSVSERQQQLQIEQSGPLWRRPPTGSGCRTGSSSGRPGGRRTGPPGCNSPSGSAGRPTATGPPGGGLEYGLKAIARGPLAARRLAAAGLLPAEAAPARGHRRPRSRTRRPCGPSDPMSTATATATKTETEATPPPTVSVLMPAYNAGALHRRGGGEHPGAGLR